MTDPITTIGMTHPQGHLARVSSSFVAVSRSDRLRLALAPIEAAQAIGCSRDFFDEHVLPELRVVRRGRKVLVPVVELERWLEREAALTLGGRR